MQTCYCTGRPAFTYFCYHCKQVYMEVSTCCIVCDQISKVSHVIFIVKSFSQLIVQSVQLRQIADIGCMSDSFFCVVYVH